MRSHEITSCSPARRRSSARARASSLGRSRPWRTAPVGARSATGRHQSDELHHLGLPTRIIASAQHDRFDRIIGRWLAPASGQPILRQWRRPTCKRRKFSMPILGLKVMMNPGWIVTYASTETMAPQISFESQGGSGTPVPDLSIEVEDLDDALRRVKAMGLVIERAVAAIVKSYSEVSSALPVTGIDAGPACAGD